MTWKFYTNINFDNDSNDSLTKALDKFFNSIKFDENELKKELETSYNKRIIINTEGSFDIIDTSSSYKFLKSKFLVNRKFKQKLIDYYKPMGIFVKGPTEIRRRDRETTNQWLIELSKIIEK